MTIGRLLHVGTDARHVFNRGIGGQLDKGFKAANDDMITAPKSLQANFTDTTTPSGHGSILNFGNGTVVTVKGALVAPTDVHFA